MSRSDLVPRFAERGKTYWPLTFALLLLLLVGFSGLGPVLRGAAWWWVMAAVAILTICSAGLFRRLRFSPAIVPLASVGVLLIVLTLFFGAGSGLLWLIPTPGTFEVWGALADAGSISIQQQAVPAVAYPGIVFLLAVGAGVIAIVTDAIAVTLRLPALAGALVLVPLAVPTLVSKSGAGIPPLVLAAAAYLLLLRVDVRTRRAAEAEHRDTGRMAPRTVSPDRRGPGPVWGSVGVGAIGIVSALVLSAATPAISDSSLLTNAPSGVLFGTGVSPLIDLGQDLRRPEESLALHYSTTADRQPYLKMLTLDDFSDDRDWVASAGDTNRGNTVENIGAPDGLTDAIATERTKTSIQIDGVVTSWLPVPYPATKVSGLTGTWTWADSALTVSSAKSSTRGQHYTVNALALKPTAEQLRASGTAYPDSVRRFTDLPGDIPAEILSTATDVTAGTSNAYDQAVALQRYLRSSVFAYSTDAPVEAGYDGGSIAVIAAFLEAKKGYCIHFASTMAVMARVLGIPSRLAVGYLPGTSTRDTFEGQTRWNVTTHDLHVWPELYFPGAGWISFEPTTGRGSIPDYAQAAGAIDTGPGAPTTAGANRPDPEKKNLDAGQSAGSASGFDVIPWLEVGGIVLLALLVLFAPFIVRRFIRARRRRAVARGRAGVGLLWAELVDTAVDAGIQVPQTETARHLAARLVRTGRVEADAVDELLVAVERDRYARDDASIDGPGRSGLVADLDGAISSIRRTGSFPARLHAALLPRSLRPEAFGPGRGRAPTPA